MSTPTLESLRRLVVKIGSALLVDDARQISRTWLDGLAGDVAELRAAGQQVLVVSSGAVALGSQALGIDPRRGRLEDLQAAAAAGQVQLVHAYQEAFGRHGIKAAQVLLTPDDTEVRRRFLNARGTLEKLLEHGIVAVINENDTVATDELRYGDNDRLAARVAQTVMADGLILLSDIDGFYTANPRVDPAARHLPVVDAITDTHLAAAGESGSRLGSGGMHTKLQAARIATHAGCTTIVASGVVESPLAVLAGGGKCTVFRAADSPAAARKQWLAGILEVCGTLRLDAGAGAALGQGASLLPVGITDVVGGFRRGDAVSLVAADGEELGRGLVAYGSEEARAITGCRSAQIEARLGYRGRSVMVHRDDMVLFDRK